MVIFHCYVSSPEGTRNMEYCFPLKCSGCSSPTHFGCFLQVNTERKKAAHSQRIPGSGHVWSKSFADGTCGRPENLSRVESSGFFGEKFNNFSVSNQSDHIEISLIESSCAQHYCNSPSQSLNSASGLKRLLKLNM